MPASPVSSRNPVLKSIIGNKPKIVLLNKSDMADPARTAEWVDYFKQHKTVAIRSTARPARA